MKFPATFSFPDETGQVGYTYILPEFDSLIQLSGEVTFRHVEQGIPVEGTFDLRDKSGNHFKGIFNAEWGSEVAICG